MTDYKAFLRRRLLEDLYDKMSDEDKQTFVLMTMQNKSSEEILSALQHQSAELEAIRNDSSRSNSFVSDLLANFTSAGVLWLGARLFGHKH